MTRKNKGGRPSKLTDELQEEMARLVETGNYLDTAAACCGINRDTFYEWMRRGAREKAAGRNTLYTRFSDRMKMAEAKAEALTLTRLRAAGREHWQADAWFLERTRPKRFGRWQRVDVGEGDDEMGDKKQGIVRIYIPDNGRRPKNECDK